MTKLKNQLRRLTADSALPNKSKVKAVGKHFPPLRYTPWTTYSNGGLACTNNPENVTISGGEVQIDYLQEVLEGKSIFARKLKTDVA